MRSLIVSFAAVLLLVPTIAWARPCSEVGGVVTFGVEPTEIEVGGSNLFRLRYRWNETCEGGTTLRFEVHDTVGSTDTIVRERERPLTAALRDVTDDNFDFREAAVREPGANNFYARILLDGRQITQSSVVTVTATGGTAPSGGPATSGGEAPPPPQVGPVDLSVAIGGLVRAETIAQYIAAVYNWAIGVAVTLSMVMVVVGGFQYLVARGNASAIGAAKSRITNAIVGLVLALGSYTILNTINPQLVQLRNLTIPPIQRAEALTNRCEDLDRSQFTVTPSTGRCGEDGTVTARGDTQVATPTCTWGVCSRPEETCIRRGSAGWGCVQCGSVTDNELGAWGLAESDEACDRFTPPNRGEVRNTCILSEGGEFDIGNDVCALVHVDCSAVERCGDYDAALIVTHGDEDIRMEAFGHGNDRDQERFGEFCDANPCGVAGGCHGRRNVGTFGSTFAGDAWDCMEGPAPSGGS